MKRTLLSLGMALWLVVGCALFEPAAQPGDPKVDPTTGVTTELTLDEAILKIEAQEAELARLEQSLLLATRSTGWGTGAVVGGIASVLLGGMFLRKKQELAAAKAELEARKTGVV